jgi:FkbM family methyltransferase
MRLDRLLILARKTIGGASSRVGRQALRLGIAPTMVHRAMLSFLSPATVLDVGANRGQFALDALDAVPEVEIISFEPMAGAAKDFRSVFAGQRRVTLHEVGLGAESTTATLHVSKADDSSSVLPIGEAQTGVFPGTEQVGTESIRIETLDTMLAEASLQKPVLLKIDVQGFELEVLKGGASSLVGIDWILVECSFVELYTGQPLAYEVVAWLADRGFKLKGVSEVTNRGGQSIQADLLFART